MSDLTTYVKKAKESKTDLQEVMERRKSKKLQELEEIEVDAYIAEAKEKIKKASPDKLDSAQTTNFAAMLFAGRKPEEIKEILSTLTQEEIDRLAYIASSMTPNGLTNFRGFLREPTTTMKDAIDAIKVGVELSRKPAETGNAVDLKGIAEIFKAGVEAAKAQNPTSQQNPMEIYKVVAEMVNPFRDALGQKDREVWELRMKELESRIVNPMEWIKSVRQGAGELGMSPAGKSEIDLRLAEMSQKERLETRRIDIEEKQLDRKLDNEGKTIEQIKDLVKTVGEGPIGEAIKMIGGAQADKMRGSVAKSNSGRVVQVKCPSCNGVFPANEQLATLTCPLCGTGLARGSQPTPQEPQPQATQSPEKTQEAQTQTEQPPAEEQEFVEPPANQ
jgi:predicted RNA-binding Zn-ribbon protein involved in translation (DUF1610 family)